ncbi:Uncharacterized protein Adt_11690 [Abeliophyllum distichum]|uniref:Uncharacterized protein n=1 Tax=Abeliophyllum distichum TaxID=126358 RepID=A0ABD1UNK4_9LAMI
MGLLYGILLIKIFHYFEVLISNEISISQKPTDTINISTLKRIKIVKEQGQWVAKAKEFDTESRSSMLHFEGDKAMGGNSQDEEDAPHLSPHSDIPSSHIPSSSSGFTFSKDHYNLLNGQIDSLTSTVDSLQHSVDGLTSMFQQVISSQQALHSCFDMVFYSTPPSEH